MKQYMKFIIPLSVAVVLLAAVELMAPRKTDWSLSFSKDDKKPYGCYIAYRMLPDIFPNIDTRIASFPTGILTIRNPVYNAIKGGHYRNLAYIFINNDFNPDKYDMHQLMDFVRQGNHVFISASAFNRTAADSLKIRTSVNFTGKYIESNFVNSSFRNAEPYKFRSPLPSYDFSITDTHSVSFKGAVSIIGLNSSGRPDFIRIKLGKGNFYLNSVPAAFTNYNNLDSVNTSYVYKALSYLPADSYVLWDEYYKSGRENMNHPLQFILSQESLRYAYYIIMLSVLLYIIFAGRRKQRIIPVIVAPENTTLEFVNTIGSLYYQQKDHKNIASKKITYFLDQLRNRYLIKTDEIKDDTLQRIAGKSGLTFNEIREIFDFIKYIKRRTDITEKELFKINSLIESFYKKAGFHG